jgi:Na+/alanine symporter
MGVLYTMICCIGICFAGWNRICFAAKEILCNAFSLSSLGCGVGGIAFIRALNTGISRGLFATDIGLGLAAIAHGNVERHGLSPTQHARKHGIASLLAPLLVAGLCAVTGILIICVAPNLNQDASKICIDTFVTAFKTPYISWLILVVIYSFALTTMLSWAWFAEHTFFFIRREHWRYYYRLIFIATIPIGGFMHTSLPWTLGDICINGLLLTNLWAIFRLRGKVLSIHNSKDLQ